MRRREFIAGLGGAAAWPLAARAQQAAMPVIGYLGGGTLASQRDRVAAFQRGLADSGYVVGKNLTIEYRWAEYHSERLPALAADLVRRDVAVIATVGGGTTAALVLKAATQTIPIVFVMGSDPVEAGVVASLNRPGGNITGISALDIAVAAKRLELMHELIPAATTIAFLVDSTARVFSETETRELQVAARTLRLHLLILDINDQSQFEAAFAKLDVDRAAGVVLSSAQLFGDNSDQLVALAARHAVPTIYSRREPTAAGGLMSLGTDFPDAFRQVGVYTGRILKGEKPADLPVQLVTKMQLTINLKTAKALGITFPITLLGRADEVIE
jgi:putative tryptophan/tyrosine transport system substrate-binding protein